MANQGAQQLEGWYALLEATDPQPQIQLWIVAIADEATARKSVSNVQGGLTSASVSLIKADGRVMAHLGMSTGDIKSWRIGEPTTWDGN